jgi:outer membrane protein, multidrug efflux system
MRNTLRPGILLLSVAGCAVGPTVKLGPPPATVTLRDSAITPAARGFFDSLAAARDADHSDSTLPPLARPVTLALDSSGDIAWLAVLRDSQLVALVRTAVANNRDLRVAVERVREYRAQLGASRGDFFPQITANGSASTNKSIFGAFPAQKFDAVRITADLSWELDFWGRLRRQTQAARFDYESKESDQRAIVLSLVSDVATAYLELRELDDDLRIAEETLISRQATLALSQRRFQQGVISELDVRQFESEVADPAARVADFSRRRSQKENELSLLLGQEPGVIPRGGPLAETVAAVAVPDSLPSSLLLRRPDVQSAEQAWAAATARVGVALGNRLPRVSITGTYGTQRPDFSKLFGSAAEVYQLQGGISIPLFTGGRLLNQQRAAQARAEQGRNHYEQAVLTALREANDALVGVRTTRDQLVAQETQVRALRRASALAQKRYENGISSYLEVLDAQRGLFTAELSVAAVQREYLTTTVQLYKALGGSWGASN